MHTQSSLQGVQGTTYFVPISLEKVGIFEAPLVEATEESLAGYGRLVDDFDLAEVDIVTWPQPGWRPVLPGTGNEGGITSGEFIVEWKGDIVYTFNHAVNKGYVTGWTTDPLQAREDRSTTPRDYIYTFEANYHPDGGQIFYPRNQEPFVMLLAKPTDDVRPEHFRAFYFDGKKGVHINPSVWHQPAFPVNEHVVFDDKQGRVHACIGCQFVEEFGVYIKVPLRPIASRIKGHPRMALP